MPVRLLPTLDEASRLPEWTLRRGVVAEVSHMSSCSAPRVRMCGCGVGEWRCAHTEETMAQMSQPTLETVQQVATAVMTCTIHVRASCGTAHRPAVASSGVALWPRVCIDGVR